MPDLDLIPKVLVVGLFAATQPGAPDRDRLNRVWAELSARQDYRQYNVTGEGANFIGASADDALLIQPPLIQFRATPRMGVQNAADEAQVAIRTVARHLGYAQFFNLGIKHVYHAPAPGGDARGFVQRLVRADSSDLSPLERGGEMWAGLKYVATSPDGSNYTLVIEPFVADNQFVFIDLDAQYPGQVDADRIGDRAAEAADYASRSVREYLENAQMG